MELDEGLNFNTAVGKKWKRLLDAYTDALVGGQYGWMAQSNAGVRRGKIANYVIDGDGFITFTLEKEIGPALPAPGKPLPFRAARLNDSHSVLNRSFIVEVISPTTVMTAVPTGALPFDSAGTFVINSKAFVRYTGAQYCILGKRSPGRPIGESPGRRKALARG